MKINRVDTAALSLVILIGIYLLAQSPVPLEEKNTAKGERIHVNRLFEIVAQENNNARKQWTKQIVVAGKKVGLKFGEDWRKNNVDKGPLPALFLRETAKYLEKSPVPLSLFLGSDYPISSANKFKGYQASVFQQIRETENAQFFYNSDVKRYTAMFPDKVVVKACASCHNKHPDTPKKDWKINDIMGATTWAYPHEYVTRDELVEVISELRKAFAKAYISFVEKAKHFKSPPEIAERWPSEGYYIPTAEIFMRRFEVAASAKTMRLLLPDSANSNPPLLANVQSENAK